MFADSSDQLCESVSLPFTLCPLSVSVGHSHQYAMDPFAGSIFRPQMRTDIAAASDKANAAQQSSHFTQAGRALSSARLSTSRNSSSGTSKTDTLVNTSLRNTPDQEDMRKKSAAAAEVCGGQALPAMSTCW